MRCLDVFCGAGGCTKGYQNAGFYVVGVDINPQPRYIGDKFYQGDALEFITKHGHEFDLIHASPPCQAYSVTAPLSSGNHPDLVGSTRKALRATSTPYVIENVPGAPLENPLMLCGTMFGLRVIRHRLFETRPVIWWPPTLCQHIGKATGSAAYYRRKYSGNKPCVSLSDGYQYVTVAGNDYVVDEGRIAMAIDWMTKKELSQAIPPIYTEYIGKQLLKELAGVDY